MLAACCMLRVACCSDIRTETLDARDLIVHLQVRSKLRSTKLVECSCAIVSVIIDLVLANSGLQREERVNAARPVPISQPSSYPVPKCLSFFRLGLLWLGTGTSQIKRGFRDRCDGAPSTVPRLPSHSSRLVSPCLDDLPDWTCAPFIP